MKFLVLIIAVQCLSGSRGHCAVIDLELGQLLTNAPADSAIEVVIRPFGTQDPVILKSDVLARFSTRAEQHREVISTLMKVAAERQASVLHALKTSSLADHVTNVREYWIDNLIVASATPAGILAMAARDDIERVQLLPSPTLVTPLSAGEAASAEPHVSQNQIKATKADSVWAAGFTGKGRLVGSLDTGVDGKHIMLSGKWRGHNGASVSASWHNPLHDDTVPRIFAGTGTSHGTLVMGLMVGVIPALNDTLGVCPDCNWISAAAIDIPCPGFASYSCANIFDALQWIADPDGDPNTEWDAPDAVANPWGAVTRGPFGSCDPTNIGCSNLFWNSIDNIEAAGTLMIFAAGNEGACGPMSIRNPANRATSELNSFSVGIVDTRFVTDNPPVDPLSSRGPSDCDQTSIKPELCAPGVNLRSTIPSDGISNNAYGTSFSTPLVAAGAAVLREYNPNATVDQIKTALLAGAKDLGAIGPDNAYGHGMLDLMESLRQLPANHNPAIYVMRDVYEPPPPGTTTDMQFVLRNCGIASTGVAVTLSTNDPKLTIVDGTATFADMIAYGDSASNESDPFEIAVSATCLPGERLPITIEISADGGYSRTISGAILVGPPNESSIFTHDAGHFRMTVGAAGSFGHQPGGHQPRPGGIGYLYGGDPTQSLFDGTFAIGLGASQISDNAGDEFGSHDVDFRTDPGGMISVQEPGLLLAEEARSAFDDSYAENPIGLFIEQRTMASNSTGHGNYLIVEYTVHNRFVPNLENMHCGLFFDWDFPWSGNLASRDGGGFDVANGVGWMRHRDQDRFRGICVVSQTPLSGYKYFNNANEIYDGFSEVEKWEAMTSGLSHALPTLEGDGSHMIGAGPFTVEFGGSTKVAFAVIGGTSVAQLLESARLARLQYAAIATPLTVDVLPGACPNELSNWESLQITYPGSPKLRPSVAGVDVAILGNGDLDASSIDPLTVKIAGIAPLSARLEDIGSPIAVSESITCECDLPYGDGYPDLVMTFDRDLIAGMTSPGEPPLSLKLSAQTHERVSQVGSDCLSLVSGAYSPPIEKGRNLKPKLGSNSPNPFNAATVIEITLENPEVVKLEVYDVLGRRVCVVVDDFFPSGQHSIVWDGRAETGQPVASGVYFARLSASDGPQVLKMVVLK